MTANNNDTYVDNFAKEGFISHIILNERLKIFKVFEKEIGCHEKNTVLDIGVSADDDYVFSNYFEELYPYKKNIIALGLFDCSFLETKYTGLKFVQGDGTQLPFEDNSIDVVFSSATIEHVGSLEKQKKFISEMIRVAKKSVFITTPNRMFPIDFHTALPLIHWLPKKAHRFILRILGKREFAEEKNLNLMLVRDFKNIVPPSGDYSFYFKYNYFLGMRANIFFILKK